MIDTIMDDMKKRMDASLTAFQRDLSGLRTGRASASLVDNVSVEVYGADMPLNQVATVSVPEARTLSVQVWDKGNVGAVEKAIRAADLGLNPVVDGTLIRLPIPPLTEERRKEMVKVAHTYAERARVAIRNVRRDGMDGLKKAEKDGDISEDEQRRHSETIQKITDEHVSKVDATLADKEKDIMTV